MCDIICSEFDCNSKNLIEFQRLCNYASDDTRKKYVHKIPFLQKVQRCRSILIIKRIKIEYDKTDDAEFN